MVWALIGAVVGAGANYYQSQQQKKAEAKRFGKADSQIGSLLSKQEATGRQSLAERMKALEAIQSGYAGALSETNRLGESSILDAQTQAAQALGSDTRSLLSMGRYSPENLAYARQGRSANLMRQIMAVNERTAAARAGILTQGAHATAGAHGDVANQLDRNFAGYAGIFGKKIDLGLSQQPVQQDYSQDIGWIARGLQSMSGGGGFGGGGS